MATDFEHRSLSDELLRCYRYYYNHATKDNAPIGNGTFYTTTSYYLPIFFPVDMRTNPSLVESSITNQFRIYSNGNITNFQNFQSIWEVSEKAIYLLHNPNGTAGHAGFSKVGTAGNIQLAFNAEL